MECDMIQNDATAEDGVMAFKFSVITAVYNVEEYLEECIQSIVEQNIGFEKNVQLILVDDGSADGSGEICDRYARQYPNNIIVVHKENGGVSSARNAGLELATGEYVNFLDSDDMLSRNALSGVYSFFKTCKDQTDIVAIPMWFFDGATGKHVLNDKFSKGSRVIRLDEEWTVAQNSLASAFVKNQVIQKYRFDTRLKNLEDAQLVQKILSDKFTLGVFSKAKYLYRRRVGENRSAVQSATQRRTWYLDCLQYFHYEVLRFYLDKCGYVPRFLQYMIAYDLQWRIQQTEIPEGVLTDEDRAQYFTLLYGLLESIDDTVIFAQKHIWKEHKLFLLRKKYGAYPTICVRENDVVMRHGNMVVSKLSQATIRVELLRIVEDTVWISGTVTVLGLPPEKAPTVIATVSGESYVAAPMARPELQQTVLSESLYAPYAFELQIPLKEQNAVSFLLFMDGVTVTPRSAPRYGVYFPVAANIKYAYCELNGYIVTCNKERILVYRSTPELLKEKEKSYCRYLRKSGVKPMKKAAIARSVNSFLKNRRKKPVWILSDRIERASDNGEALALYLKDHAKEIDSYFCLRKDSPDYPRLKALGLKILEPYSKEYKIRFLLADVLLSSQAENAFLRPMRENSIYYQDILAKKKFVFLQHGITQNDVSKYYGKFAANISLFVTAAVPERRSVLEGSYHYREDEVALTGFARYDRLYSTDQKTILFAPTWRSSLVGGIDLTTGKRTANAGAEGSEYCRLYSALLSDCRLIEAAKRYGYSLKFVVHPNMADVMRLMRFAPEVECYPSDAEYREIFANGSLMVTDYSSVAFDFAYLRKPIVYFQFDADEFFNGHHTLKKGYFDCERDGFGEVVYDLDSTVDLLIDYMKNGCALKDQYRERINRFFAFNDNNNCRRIVERILEMESKS